MRDLLEPIELILHHDVLCGWSAVADDRLRSLREELGGAIRLERRPFMGFPDDRLPTKRERLARASALRRVAKEREAAGFVPDLWRSDDPPRSSLAPLVALEAAKIIGGEAAHDRLLAALRRAAFHHGINVSREDILIELGERCGLETTRFAAALGAQGLRRLVSDQHEASTFRGIDTSPSLVIGGEWLVSGVRSIDEYRDTIQHFSEQNGIVVPERVVH